MPHSDQIYYIIEHPTLGGLMELDPEHRRGARFNVEGMRFDSQHFHTIEDAVEARAQLPDHVAKLCEIRSSSQPEVHWAEAWPVVG